MAMIKGVLVGGRVLLISHAGFGLGGVMTGDGLMWLDEYFGEQLNFCLTFVRDADERAALAAFGADPDEAVLRTRQETAQLQDSWEQGYGPFVRVGRAGQWLFAWEEGSWEGRRPEVLRRVSAGEAEAVTVFNALGSFAGFGYAARGEVITSLVTIVPYTREGSDPDRFLPIIRDAGLVLPPQPGAEPPASWLWSVLTIAERAFGLSLGEADLDGPLLCARMLPVLPVLPARSRPPGTGGPWRIGDPVIDLLMAHADEQVLRSAVAGQVLGVLADSGLDGYAELARAVEEALAGAGGPVADESQAGLVLRRIGREQYEAEQDSYSRRRRLPPGERRLRTTRHEAAKAIHAVLTWGPEPGLAAVVHFRRRRGSPVWREQFLRGLAGTQVPAADLREAEQRWRAEQEEGISRRPPAPPGPRAPG
jgi:hypothetical protein